MNTPPRLALLYCSVFEGELKVILPDAPHVVCRTRFEIGLHDQPDRLRATLQEAVNNLDGRSDIDAVVLLYGLCGRGTAGLRAGRHPLVIARAHDCITYFLGSKEAFAEHRPGHHYFFTPGWNQARRVPGPDRAEAIRAMLAEKFEPDDVEFLVETDRAQFPAEGTAIFLDLGTPDAEAEAAYAKRCADWLGWRFERRPGDPSLVRDLLGGRWDDDRFQIAQPGEVLVHVVNERILAVRPAHET